MDNPEYQIPLSGDAIAIYVETQGEVEPNDRYDLPELGKQGSEAGDQTRLMPDACAVSSGEEVAA